MSSNQPHDPAGTEYLDDDWRPAGSSSGRKKILAGVGAGVIVVLGSAGAYGFMQFMSAGESAATAVPADALGYLSLDLDPSGSQKLAAYETMRKFPALKEQLNLSSDKDPRRWLFDALMEEAPPQCKLDYADDVEPWMGNKVAFSGVDTDDGPQPFVVLEVSDVDAAEQTIETLFTCDSEEKFGTATAGEFLIVAPSAELAGDIAADASDASLSDDETFQARLGEAGDEGIVTGYVAPAAIDVLVEQVESGADDFSPGFDSAVPGTSPGATTGGVVPPADPQLDLLRDYVADFDGAAMQVRFADEGVEMEMVASGITQVEGLQAGSTGLTDLPDTTAVAYGLSTGPDFVETFADSARGQMSDAEYDAQIQMFEQQTGLAFPEDVQTLLGDGLSVALDGSLDLEALQQAFTTGQTQGLPLPVGLRIVSDDTGAVLEVTDKLESLLPSGLPVTLEVEEGDGAVAIGVDADYVSKLAGDGDLGDSSAFQNALPDAEDSVGGLYIDFDADNWLDDLVGEQDPGALENVEPLSSLGMGATVDDDSGRVLMRLTTD